MSMVLRLNVVSMSTHASLQCQTKQKPNSFCVAFPCGTEQVDSKGQEEPRHLLKERHS